MLPAISIAETKCIAHMGLHTSVPKNSLAALVAAKEAQADGIEFDIQHTLDGEAIVMHDKTLKESAMSRRGRECPLKKKISKMLLKEIRENCQLKNSDESIPTLSEALESLKDYKKLIFIEFKDRPSKLTGELIQSHFESDPEKLRIISFNPRHFNKGRIQNPFWDQVRFLDLDVFLIKERKNQGINLFNRSYGLRKRFLRETDAEVSVWTVNSIKRMEYFFKEKVDFVTTDRLIECLEIKRNSESN